MSKIKNTKELVLRADSHARHDRIQQGTYGEAEVNGHAEYKGCFIGCLSTPHRKRDLFTFLRGKKDQWGDIYFDEDKQRVALKREFGIPISLSRVLESIFEGLPTHGAAIEFIPAAARKIAACEGQRITRAQVEAFVACTPYAEEDESALDGDSAESVRDALFAWLDKRAAR